MTPVKFNSPVDTISLDAPCRHGKGVTYITIGKASDAAEYLLYHKFLIDEAESSGVLNKNMIFVLHYFDIMFLRDESGQRVCRDPDMKPADRDSVLFLHVASLCADIGTPIRSPGIPQRKYDATTLSPGGFLEVVDVPGGESELGDEDPDRMPEGHIVSTHSVHIIGCVCTHRTHLLISHHFITTCVHCVYVTSHNVHSMYTG